MNIHDHGLSKQVREVVAAIFDMNVAEVTDETSYESNKAWDSVGHINLMLALQEEFSIMILPEQSEELTSVAAITAFLTEQKK